jgi:hypothetical protein
LKNTLRAGPRLDLAQNKRTRLGGWEPGPVTVVVRTWPNNRHRLNSFRYPIRAVTGASGGGSQTVPRLSMPRAALRWCSVPRRGS